MYLFRVQLPLRIEEDKFHPCLQLRAHAIGQIRANEVVEQTESYLCTIFQEILSFFSCQLQRPHINLTCPNVTNKSIETIKNKKNK